MHKDTSKMNQMENHLNAAPAESRSERSPKACFLDAWKLFAGEWGSFLRFTGCQSLLAGTGMALFLYFLDGLLQRTLLPACLWSMSGEDPALAGELFAPTWADALPAVLAAAAFLAGYCLWKAATVTQIRFYRSTGHLPLRGGDMRGSVRRDARRLFGFEALMLALTLLIAAGGLLLAGKSPWYLLPAALLLCVLWTGGMTARLFFTLHGEPLLRSWKLAFTQGGKRLGGYLIILLLTAMPVCWMGLVALLPAGVLGLSGAYGAAGRLMGDPAAMPWYTGLLYLLTGAVCGTSYFLVRSLQIWALSLKFPYKEAAERQAAERLS